MHNGSIWINSLCTLIESFYKQNFFIVTNNDQIECITQLD